MSAKPQGQAEQPPAPDGPRSNVIDLEFGSIVLTRNSVKGNVWWDMRYFPFQDWAIREVKPGEIWQFDKKEGK